MPSQCPHTWGWWELGCPPPLGHPGHHTSPGTLRPDPGARGRAVGVEGGRETEGGAGLWSRRFCLGALSHPPGCQVIGANYITFQSLTLLIDLRQGCSCKLGAEKELGRPPHSCLLGRLDSSSFCSSSMAKDFHFQL